MTLPFLCLYLCSFILSTTAANDWNKPCFSGVCEYGVYSTVAPNYVNETYVDIPSANGLSSGTLKIVWHLFECLNSDLSMFSGARLTPSGI